MKYIDVNEASAKWGISSRRIRLLCQEGRIDGAIKLGWSWTIPSDTPKPSDGRTMRRYTNRNIRPGVVDVEALKNLSETYPVTDALKEDPKFQHLISKSLGALLAVSGHSVLQSSIDKILKGHVVASLPLETHLIILNFRSILLHLVSSKEKWSEKDIREIYVRLMQGIDDVTSDEYREGYALYNPRSEEDVKVGIAMETALKQYEMSWRNMHPLTCAVILYSEMLRIQPYSEYNELFSYLVLAGELLRNGILPPLAEKENAEEEKAALLLAVKRGNYGDFSSFVERCVVKSYKVS